MHELDRPWVGRREVRMHDGHHDIPVGILYVKAN